MKFFIEAIGCQQNGYDASRLAIFLKSAGLFESSAEESDIIFILACSVRQTAVDRIFGRIRNWNAKSPSGKKTSHQIIVTSCLTPDDQKKIIERGVSYWEFGDIESLEKIIGEKFNNRTIEQSSDSVYIPIMIGCNNFCSYCIVPYTRGRERSRPADEVILEASELIKSGKKQIILLGQNVNSYEFGFTKLLKDLDDLPGDFVISFISNHPKDMTADVIEAIVTLSKVKKEIHLPLQSGSDRILKLMNRPYSSKQYLELIENCKSKIENLLVTTDIIVGFPGETEEDFQQTVDICKKVEFSLAYVNKYSPRKGTVAYSLGDPISWVEKQQRWKILNHLVNKKL